MASMVDDLELSRTQKVDKNYIWGTIANGNVLSAYLKYTWGPQEGERKVDRELKSAGAKWLDNRPADHGPLRTRVR